MTTSTPTVLTYGETRRGVWLGCCLAFTFLIGIPVAIGCLDYVYAGATRWEAMFHGAMFVTVPLAVLSVWGWFSRRGMIRALGRPLDSGERVQVVSGPLQGYFGTVKFHGQGGPMTLYVVMDNAPDNESIVFEWRHLRRVPS